MDMRSLLRFLFLPLAALRNSAGNRLRRPSPYQRMMSAELWQSIFIVGVCSMCCQCLLVQHVQYRPDQTDLENLASLPEDLFSVRPVRTASVHTQAIGSGAAGNHSNGIFAVLPVAVMMSVYGPLRRTYRSLSPWI